MSTFLDAVNEVLRLDGIISGDDDAISSFSSNQHTISIQLAQSAVKSELASLTAEALIPYEKTDTTLTLASATRTVTLASDFIRFQDVNPKLLEVDASDLSQARWIVEWPGGEESLRREIMDYREQSSDPQWWYWVGGTTKDIGFYPLLASGTKYYRYYYEKDVQVSNASDTLPFVTASEFQKFSEMAARHFKFLTASPPVRERLFPRDLAGDPVVADARATLLSLLSHKQPPRFWGRRYL